MVLAGALFRKGMGNESGESKNINRGVKARANYLKTTHCFLLLFVCFALFVLFVCLFVVFVFVLFCFCCFFFLLSILVSEAPNYAQMPSDKHLAY